MFVREAEVEEVVVVEEEEEEEEEEVVVVVEMKMETAEISERGRRCMTDLAVYTTSNLILSNLI
jgi:hypothetical protein